MAQQELNLLQLAASGSAQAGATSAEIVRRKLGHADLGGKFFDDMPDELFCHAFTPNLASATHVAEQAATGNACGFHPVVQQTMHPIRNGDGPNVASLPPQIYDCPMPFALLEMANRQRGEFVAAEPASEKHAEQSSIPFALGPFAIWCLPESVALVGS